MNKKLFLKVSFLFSFFFILISTSILNADCVSCNGYLDNGKCDKSDINNKVCMPGTPADCYRGSCPPNPPQQ